jgi:hypothetical protein
VADLSGDGIPDVVVGTGYRTDQGRLHLFKGGAFPLPEVWESDVIDSRVRGVAVADVNGDGLDEIICGNGAQIGGGSGIGYLRIFRMAGGSGGRTWAQDWKSDNVGGDVGGLRVADADGDGTLDIVIGTGYQFNEGYLKIYNAVSHVKEAEADSSGAKAYGLDVADIDGDGKAEIMQGNQVGLLSVYNFDGRALRLKWQNNFGGTLNDLFGIAAADLDNDNSTKVIALGGGYLSSGGTSSLTTSRIFILDGRTGIVEGQSGSNDYTGILIEVGILVLVLALLVQINVLLRLRRKKDVM